MQRTIFGKKTPGAQRPRVDRFVAPRDSFEELRLRSSWNTRERCNHDIWVAKYLQKKNYTSYLDEAFGLETLAGQKKKLNTKNGSVEPWPCAPRKKRYLSSADSILDLPSYSNAPFPDLLDWSNDNIIVAALGRHYHKWSWRTQSLVNSGYSQQEIQCCKFDPRGELLLLGTNPRMVEVHDNISSKMITAAFCRCPRDIKPHCSITALDWSPTGNSFVTGCSFGTISSFTRDALPIAHVGYIRKTVLMIRVSPDARLLAAAVVNRNSIIIYLWPDLGVVSSIASPDWDTQVFAWHPWRTSFLGVAAMHGDVSRLATWDINVNTMSHVTLSHSQYIVDTLLFSQRTGEMVLSLWHPNSIYPRTNSHLLVLSDPETVVDQWGEGRSGLDRVRTMVFSPDGTKLATATVDEDLIIWNFLPEDSAKYRPSSRRLSALPVYLDETTYGLSIR
ncbi:protein cortex-like [Plodia interpunctella]|uniref:protein cortex-like n=1 Tax=Plodia interpunctella TaxID=58824 RepID=UPI002367C04B|nr:protein cortex-like [Plodia interpunctella]